MTRLILVRHGESEANHGGIFAGQIDPDLHDNGLKQAKLTARYIADNYKVDKIYSSDLKRAFKTGQCLADILNTEIISNKNLREISAGKWEGMRFDDITEHYPEEFEMWLNHIGYSQCPDGENVHQLAQRVMKTLNEIANENDGKTVAIFTHATVIRAAQCTIQYGSLEKMEYVPWVSNASVTVFKYEAGKWNIELVSEEKHLAECKTVLPANV